MKLALFTEKKTCNSRHYWAEKEKTKWNWRLHGCVCRISKFSSGGELYKAKCEWHQPPRFSMELPFWAQLITTYNSLGTKSVGVSRAQRAITIELADLDTPGILHCQIQLPLKASPNLPALSQPTFSACITILPSRGTTLYNGPTHPPCHPTTTQTSPQISLFHPWT